jgi:hypothetical protein
MVTYICPHCNRKLVRIFPHPSYIKKECYYCGCDSDKGWMWTREDISEKEEKWRYWLKDSWVNDSPRKIKEFIFW